MNEEHDDFKHLDDMEENEPIETEDDEVSSPIMCFLIIIWHYSFHQCSLLILILLYLFCFTFVFI